MTTSNRIKDSLNYQTCLCCMCRCGDHKCFQQMAMKLPSTMQKELVYINKDDVSNEIRKKKPMRAQADLYKKSLYRQDYCEQPDIIDQFPLEHIHHPENVKQNWSLGYPVNDSTYRNDYIPWSHEDQALCRAKLHVPDQVPKEDDRRSDFQRCPTEEEYNYYCPPHCLGNETPEKKVNCLLGHEKQFNLGPPVQRTCQMAEKSPHPFAKYSNYMLDYKGSKIPPKRKLVKPYVEKSEYPMSSETSYRDAFNSPPEMEQKPAKREGQSDTLTIGDGPMVQESTSMLDYKDPDVGLRMPMRPPRYVYQQPTCSMETSTTTGSTYKRWKDLPPLVRPYLQKDEDTSFSQHETDVRRLITTYQEDYDGINSALCPCRVVEKYGPKVLEPCYCYRKSNSLHDMFCVNNDHERRSKICLHG